ncbi:hypothetical protein [Pseudoalteromonas luteoviolacea]|uniref:DUF637 domain-containing protein n=1 Tax=Pseudoalteromonas luteoviolacea S4060-1 TaxID=1365257 RepID=A0A167JBU6_9GAMM|nr:hypothetical protein [Pseudoalteromonas luteoviolacea]KZN60880.1 hypothetical protein N478_26090 [Pseudoalteromonas luteoviolacea S4060-1]
MNGRIYDVDTGRVMQADPVVQAPMNLQNLIKALHNLSKKINRQFIRGAAKVFGAQVVNIVGNILSGFCGPAVGVCAAAWNYEFTRAMGGSPSQALKAGVIGGLTAQAFYEIGQHFNSLGANNLEQFGSVEGAKAAGLMEFGGNMLTSGQVAAQITSHALVGGVSAVASGGKFGHGFISAGVTKGAGGAFLPGGRGLEFHQIAQGTVISAVIGGTVSEITGGKFANGARTGAMQYVLNQASKVNYSKIWKDMKRTWSEYWGDVIDREYKSIQKGLDTKNLHKLSQAAAGVAEMSAATAICGSTAGVGCAAGGGLLFMHGASNLYEAMSGKNPMAHAYGGFGTNPEFGRKAFIVIDAGMAGASGVNTLKVGTPLSPAGSLNNAEKMWIGNDAYQVYKGVSND